MAVIVASRKFFKRLVKDRNGKDMLSVTIVTSSSENFLLMI